MVEQSIIPRPKVILKRGREKPLLRGHPWVFSGAVERTEGEIVPGDIGEVYSMAGQFLGTGHLNPQSQIVFRLLSPRREETGVSFFEDRILKAFRFRERWLTGVTNAYRVVNGEGDFLPGLIIDRYGAVFVVQFLTAGTDRMREFFVDFLAREFHPESIYERSDASIRREEGLPESRGLL